MSKAIHSVGRRVGGASLVVAIALGSAVLGVAEARDATESEHRAAGALAYAPEGSGILYRSDGKQLHRSTDAGKSWDAVMLPTQAQPGEIRSIRFAADNRALYVAGPGFGVLRSDDSGTSWSALQGLPNKEITAFAVHSTAPDTVFAVVADEGIYRSEDAGKTWKLMDKGPRAAIQRLIHTNMAGSMQTGWLYAATDKGVYRSMDCFCGFRRAGELSSDVSALTFDPREPAQVFASSGKQILVSENGGEAWRAVSSPGEALALQHTPQGTLLALRGQGQLMQSDDDGKTWRRTDE